MLVFALLGSEDEQATHKVIDTAAWIGQRTRAAYATPEDGEIMPVHVRLLRTVPIIGMVLGAEVLRLLRLLRSLEPIVKSTG